MLVFGSALYGSAEDVHDGDILNAGTNISVTKDETTKTITISTDGVATSAEVDAVKTDVQKNQTAIADNTGKIADNSTKIANNKIGINQNSNDIQQNKTDIAANKNAITANTGKIKNNTDDITELKNVNSALGLDKTKPGIKYFRANSTGEDAAAAGEDAVAIGVSAKANGKDSVALGDDARSASSAENSIAIGREAVSGSFNDMTGDGDSSTVDIDGGKASISIGDAANARGNSSIALGDGATVYNDGTNDQLNDNSMAIGTKASTVASNNAIALGNHAAVKKNSHSSVAIGDSATASAADALAFGKSAAASGADSIAAGTEAAASGADALAMGKSAQASGADAVALGNGAVAGGSASVVLGKNASANAVRSVVLGPSAGVGMVGDVLKTKGSHVVIGDGAGNNIDGQQNIAIGYRTGNDVKSDHNVAIGSEAGTNIGSSGNTSEGKNVSIGYHANKNDSAVSRIQSTALGSETKAADDAVAVGYQAQANGNGSTAIGFNAQAADVASVALGQGAQAAGGNVAIGNGSVANAAMISGTGYLTGQAVPKTAVSVGNASALRRITNVADGALDQDAVTVAQLKKSIDATVAQVNANVSSATASGVYYDTVTSGDGDSITLRNNDNKGTKIHNVAAGTVGTDAANVAQVKGLVDTAKTHYYSVKSTNQNNYHNDLATGEDSMAAGVGAKALGDRSVAIGNNTEAQSLGSITVGASYEDPANPGSLKQTLAISGYQYNTAIGAGAQAAGNNSLAIGTLATSSIKNGGSSVDKAVAIGYSAGVSDDKAIAIGSDAKSNSKSASAMGDTAQALARNALAIGTNAQAAGVSSGAIGTQNRVTGANTYVLGSQNSTAATGTAADVSASNSGIFGNENRMEGDSNRIVGNSNKVEKASMAQSGSTTPKKLEDIMVTGNGNVVSGDPDTATARDAGDVTGITVTGSKNKVVAKNNKGKNLTDIQIVGNNNEIDTSDKDRDLSNTQILGSNVKATLGNSTYIGSGSAYVVSGTTTKGMETYSGNGTYGYAGGTPAGVVTVGSVGKERRIQNVASGLVSNTSTDAVNGSQLYTMTRPLRFAGDNSTIGTTSGSDVNVLHRGSDQAMSLLGGADSNNLSDKNIGVVADAANNKMTVKLANNITLGKADPNGSDGSISVLAEKGGEVRIHDGSVMLRNSGDSDAIYLQSHIAGATSLDGSSKARLYVIQGSTKSPQEVALLTDGMIYGGDAESAGLDPATNKSNTGKEIKKVLNQQVNVIGGITNTTKFTAEDNLGVVSDGTNNLKVRLAKDLRGISSISNQTTTGGTTTGTKITLGNITNIVNVGGAKITNVAAGDVNSMSTDAVNGSQLYQTNQNVKAAKTVVNAGQNVTVTSSVGADKQSVYTVNADLSSVASAIGGTSSVDTKTGAVKAGLTVNGNTYNNVQDAVNAANTTVSSTDGSVKVTPTNNTNGSHNYDVSVDYSKVAENAAISYKANNSTAQTVTLKKGLDFTNGKNTTASVGADGVVKYDLNDNLNLGEKGTNGKDGSIGVNGTNGSSVTINGKDGSIGMVGEDGKDGLTMKAGKNGADGMTRIVYEDDGHVTHEVATLDDGLKFAGNTGSVAKKLNSTMTIKGNGTKEDKEYDASNIKTVVDVQGDLVIGLDKNLKADTVTVGGQGKDGADGINGAIGVKGADGKDGVTISSIGKDGTNGTDGHIGINGKDGASADIHVVKGANGVDGTDGYNGTDGIDRIVYEDHNRNTQTVATMNDGMKYGGDVGNVINKKLNGQVNVVGGITDSSKLSTEDNIGVVSDGSDNLKVRLSKDLKGLDSVTTKTVTADTGNITTVNASTVNVGDTTITTGGMTIQNGSAGQDVTLNKDGLDNGGNQIHNVAAGTAGTDAVNVSQLKDEIAKNATKLVDGKNTTVTGNGTKDDPYKVNVNDNLNLGEKGTNGKDGSIGVNGTNGSSVTINGKDGSIGMVGEDGKDGLTMKAGKNGADGMTRIVYEDDGHVTHEVATLDDGLKFAGNTGSVAKKLNSTMTIKGNGTKEDKEYDASNIKTVVDVQGDLVIGLDKNLKADTVTVGGQGKDGADGINGAIGVKGADGKDGVTISSIGKDGTNGTDGHIGINGKDGASADIHVVKGANGVDGTDGYNGTDGIDRIVYEDHNRNTQTVATMNDGMKYGGDVGNVINKKLNGQVNVVGGITDSSKLSTEDNIGVVSDGSDNLKVRLSKDLKGLDSVTTKTVTADTGNITTVNASTVNVGDTTITTGGMTIQNGSAGQDVTLNKDGLNNGGNKITNVAPGDISSTSTDAVNGSQLYGTETRINRLGNRINHVGAGAAALAGLHPLDFDPDDKWDFAAGYGNYKNANAVAIGAYYRPNEDTMFSVGGSFSGGENMVNVGVSWKFGQKSHISRSRVSMAKDMLAMKNQIETLTKKLAAYESGQPVKLAPIATGAMAFPDVPENHWAYEYVKNLAERGYLKGYPDGEFKGDRAMTRYEYAAIIYRALQNGAPSDGNMTRSVDDFGPELVKVQNIDRFRVDRISGKDNDRHKVERVRVNDKDDKAQNVYRDVYGNHIQK
ncbi:YadA-like family protein [uncultured Dialister sp.]|uniref:YadA-like family protein n=1 Tax=uncultured Dialister sp. TaxID=278064 RepID=UPI0026E0A9AF|nr:YadA-like family protein [uncultured Dialister sp.]